ncbi:hypothetical protein D8674_008873 [Pyrus ussuriensis x Pyrus communis]|uniref:Reverse transcriptase Ty1/copia-type domain-containing protein n=1 Tax=Pyrus ussuriensis x Pyrus communis TaxID=2448454 RepID=A0A5N5I6Z4_9ROSA|nr:hypothetical protein D8674_008873 [Pyrus ussuriensis x Pyrus communis]
MAGMMRMVERGRGSQCVGGTEVNSSGESDAPRNSTEINKVPLSVSGGSNVGLGLVPELEAQEEINNNSIDTCSNMKEVIVQDVFAQLSNVPREVSKHMRNLELKHTDLALSAQKKIKKGESGASKKGKERFRNLNVQEMCLEGECAIYAEEDLHEVPVECQEYWEYLVGIREHDKRAIQARKAGGSSSNFDDIPLNTAVPYPSSGPMYSPAQYSPNSYVMPQYPPHVYPNFTNMYGFIGSGNKSNGGVHNASDCHHWNNFSYQSITPTSSLTSMQAQGPFTFLPPDSWIVEIGVSHHITAGVNSLQHVTPYQGTDKITIGNGEGLPIQHIGPESQSSYSLVLFQVPIPPSLVPNVSTSSQGIEENHSIDFSASNVSDTSGTTSRDFDYNVSTSPSETTPSFSSTALVLSVLDPAQLESPSDFSFIVAINDSSNTTSFRTAATNVHWQTAMQEEFEALQSQGTWVLVPPPTHRFIITSKWVFKHKKNPDGFISRYKARFVAQRYNQELGLDYFETFSPAVRHTTVRLIISLAAQCKWDLRQLEIKNAFLHKELEEELAMGFQMSQSDTSLFVKHDGVYVVALLLYVDDRILTVKRILRYVQGIIHCGLTYSASLDQSIIAFSDLDWAADPNTRKVKF